jgi:hypothetical protein
VKSSLPAMRANSGREAAFIFRMTWPRWTFTVISLLPMIVSCTVIARAPCNRGTPTLRAAAIPRSDILKSHARRRKEFLPWPGFADAQPNSLSQQFHFKPKYNRGQRGFILLSTCVEYPSPRSQRVHTLENPRCGGQVPKTQTLISVVDDDESMREAAIPPTSGIIPSPGGDAAPAAGPGR